MRNTKSKLGFTLIELLVVITIIGILATGAVSVFTSQIQKARDSTRVTDMNALRGGLEQAFADMTQYPVNTNTPSASAVCNYAGTDFTTKSSVACITQLGFLGKLPSDPKLGQNGSGTVLNYTYIGAAKDGVAMQTYELSTGLEAKATRENKASNSGDGGDDPLRLEFGQVSSNLDTSIPHSATNAAKKQCANVGTAGTTAVVISGGDCA